MEPEDDLVFCPDDAGWKMGFHDQDSIIPIIVFSDFRLCLHIFYSPHRLPHHFSELAHHDVQNLVIFCLLN